MIRVAILTTDNREHHRKYELANPYFGPAIEALFQGLAELPNLEVHVVSCTQKPMHAPEKLSANTWFHLLNVPKIGWLRTGYQGCVRATRKFLRELQPDIVHGQGTERDCAISAVFSGFPSVLTIHGNMRLIAKINHARVFSYGWCAAKLEQFTLPRVGGVICVSNHTRSLVKDAARQTWLIPNAVSSEFFMPRPTHSDGKDILCIGTICRLKNQNALIRALDILASRRDFRLLFLGQGAHGDLYFNQFLQLVSERSWCIHEGFVANEQLKTFFKRAVALALPSLEDNCPMVILEAFAAGVPVMAANVGGIPDIVQDGHDGLLFDPYDPSSIASAAERYLSDYSFARQMADNARIAAEGSYHPTLVGKQHLEVYEQVLITEKE